MYCIMIKHIVEWNRTEYANSTELLGIYNFDIFSNENKNLNPWTNL